MTNTRGPEFTPPPDHRSSTARPATSPRTPTPGQHPQADVPPRGRGPIRPATVAVTLCVGLVLGGVGHSAWRSQEPGSTVVAAPPPPTAEAGSVAAVATAVMPSVVQIDTRGGTGSGFVVDGGLALTNAHVVGSASTVGVSTADGRRLTATVIGTDRGADVAVLQLPANAALAPLAAGASSGLQVGESVVAFGSPLGLSGTVTSGIVSAVDRRTRVGRAIQTDAAINPGNSGGPLVNGQGQVIGLNTMIATTGGGGSIGIGFAVPIETAMGVVERMRR
jgi:putative serine protease PepD